MKTSTKVELLAPAGNKEGFYGAIHAGADAVYLGGNRFGARAYANNFTEYELIECIRYAHLWGRKVYLTINTLVKESEFGDIYEYLCPYYEAGLDGVIIQDIGVLGFVREHFPGMELHASTQMTLTGVDGVRMLQNMGVCRVVPARELSLDEIHTIKEETGVAIEAFVHGAMCYCYSGQCLFSSILGGRSGNRGRCAQPCRLPYKTVDGNKECYPLSLKDMCTIEHIPALIEAGIDSFKIEGRMKKPEYAAGVTAIYRKYIDAYYAGKNIKVSNDDWKELAGLYIRSERQDGYYYKHNGRDMITLDSPAYSGSDDIRIARIRENFIETRPKRNISVYGCFMTGSNAKLTFTCGDITVTVEGEMVQKAGKQPITEENIRKQLGKLGDSIFTIDSSHGNGMEIYVSEDAFYPLGAINALRRYAVSELEHALIEGFCLSVSRDIDAVTIMTDNKADSLHFVKDAEVLSAKSAEESGYTVSVRSIEQLEAVVNAYQPAIRRIYINGDLLVTDRENVLRLCHPLKTEIIIALNTIIRKRDKHYLDVVFEVLENNKDLFAGLMVKSLDGMGVAKSRHFQGAIYGDSGFYNWNARALQEWENDLDGFCLPVELKGGEQKALLNQLTERGICPNMSCEKMIYGRIAMMHTANCIAQTTSGCKQNSPQNTSGKGAGNSKRFVTGLTDRYQKVFPVELNCLHCMNTIYNSVPLSLHGELSKWKKSVLYRMDFTTESSKETTAVLDFFLRDGAMPFSEYTTGHEKRGVE